MGRSGAGDGSSPLFAPLPGIQEKLEPRGGLQGSPPLLGHPSLLPGEERPLVMGHDRQVSAVGGAKRRDPIRRPVRVERVLHRRATGPRRWPGTGPAGRRYRRRESGRSRRPSGRPLREPGHAGGDASSKPPRPSGGRRWRREGCPDRYRRGGTRTPPSRRTARVAEEASADTGMPAAGSWEARRL